MKVDVDKIIELIVKMNCGKEGYCKYLEDNCYEYCRYRVMIEKIKKEAEKGNEGNKRETNTESNT